MKITSLKNVFLARDSSFSLLKELARPEVLKVGRVVEEIAASQRRGRVINGFSHCRVVLDGDDLTGHRLETLRLVGTTSDPAASTYTPLERCKHGHPPLRYMSNGGCVYCCRKPRSEDRRLGMWVRGAGRDEFDAAVSALGWSLAYWSPKERWGYRACSVRLPASVLMEDALALALALGALPAVPTA